MSEELSVRSLEVDAVPLPKIQFCVLNFSWLAICPLPSSFSPLSALLSHMSSVLFIVTL